MRRSRVRDLLLNPDGKPAAPLAAAAVSANSGSVSPPATLSPLVSPFASPNRVPTTANAAAPPPGSAPSQSTVRLLSFTVITSRGSVDSEVADNQTLGDLLNQVSKRLSGSGASDSQQSQLVQAKTLDGRNFYPSDAAAAVHLKDHVYI
ncbi:hypothetical protein HDU86_004569 [Geranomyces michiganensis]|nr:hypothetical protein HDU86_004569 [Geranomyces michiganensis]